MSGHYWMARSLGFVAGYRHGHRRHSHSHAFAWAMAAIAFILLGASAGIFWGSFEVALRNQSIGDVAPVKVVGKWGAWWRVHPMLRLNMFQE